MIVPVSFVASAGMCFALIAILFPFLRRNAMVWPNVRSSHDSATPQGGGIGVVGATLLVSMVAQLLSGATFGLDMAFFTLAAAAITLAVLGAVDDIHPLKIAPRLAVQAICVTAVVLVAVGEVRLLGEAVPLFLERLLVIIAGIWFVNLTNFMDGLDWLTVAAITPISTAVAIFGVVGIVGTSTIVLAAALSGALIGFAPFNRPPAKLFLGDVGSLPIGLIVASLLLSLAISGAWVAATILPLYYFSDATITLLRRFMRRERVWEAHRTHFYQRATDNGFSVRAIAAHVFVTNCLLALLATATLHWQSTAVDIGVASLAILLVAGLLYRFAHPRRVANR